MFAVSIDGKPWKEDAQFRRASVSEGVEMSERESWLNGWPRIGEIEVLIGTGVHCVGCGKSGGITTVALTADMTFPDRAPDWPFDERSCPVCALLARQHEAPTDRLTARLLALRNTK